jgi:hypothetical protein
MNRAVRFSAIYILQKHRHLLEASARQWLESGTLEGSTLEELLKPASSASTPVPYEDAAA